MGGHVTVNAGPGLQHRQDRRKVNVDANRRDVHFAVGAEVLLDAGTAARTAPTSR